MNYIPHKSEEKKILEPKYCGKGFKKVCESRILNNGCVNFLWNEVEHDEIRIKKKKFIYVFLK